VLKEIRELTLIRGGNIRDKPTGVAHGVDRSLFFRFFAHFSYISLKSCNSVDRFLSDHPSIFFPVFLRFSVSLQEPWKLVETHRRS
jgi:hypothetical protein